MCGYIRFDKIRNEVIKGKIGVTFIYDKIRRRSLDAPVRRCEKIDHPNHKRSRSKSRVKAELLDTI